LLNFLSGYRSALHRLTGRGAWSTILSLVLSAYLSADPNDSSSSILSTSGMISCSTASLASLTQIKTHSEKDHETLGPAVKVGTKDPDAFEVLELVENVLKETGGVLNELGYESLGEWFKEELCRLNGDSGAMIHSVRRTWKSLHFLSARESRHSSLSSSYPFANRWLLLSQHSPIFTRLPRDQSTSSRKLFGPSTQLKSPSPPPVLPQTHHSLSRLTPINSRYSQITFYPVRSFPPPALPPITSSTSTKTSLSLGMLLHLSILPPSSSASATPTILRASSVHACQLIVQRAKELGSEREGKEWLREWNEVGLDGYLWSLAKEGGRREEVERVKEKGTVFY